MISAVLCGRSDRKEGGSDKGLAISLNTLAYSLEGSAYEIIYVDWLTPDHALTLPEVIWDTLLPDTRACLRILRVRQSTCGGALRELDSDSFQALALNVAVRRSSPESRWIVFADDASIILCPRRGGVAEALKTLDGTPHRFGDALLPELCWTGLVRTDPESCIDLAARWTSDPATYSSNDADEPGIDLIPRQIFFAAQGLDETRKLKEAKRVFVDRLSDQFGGVKRLPASRGISVVRSAARSSGGGTNDEQPSALVRHADRWGLADETIEEIRLDRAPGEDVHAALARVRGSFGSQSIGQAVGEILPLLAPAPRSAAIVFAGTRAVLLDALCQGLASLGFKKKILIPETMAARLGAAAREHVQVCPDTVAQRASQVAILDLTIDPDGGSVDVGGFANTLFQVEEAQAVFGFPPRSILLVGTPGAPLTEVFGGVLNLDPASREAVVRVGRIGTQDRNGRDQAFAPPSGEVRNFLTRLAAADPLSPADRFAVAGCSEEIGRWLNDDRFALAFWPNAALAKRRFEAATAAREGLARLQVPKAPDTLSVSGPARSDSWRHPEWARLAATFGVERSGWIWERAQTLFAIERLKADEAAAGSVLVIVENEEPLLPSLVRTFGSIDVLDVRRLSSDRKPVSDVMPGLPAGAAEVGTAALSTARYRLIVAPHASLFRDGVSGLGPLLLKLRACLVDGGHLILCGETALLDREAGRRPGSSMAAPDGFPAAAALAGLVMMAPEGWGWRRGDLALVADGDDRSGAIGQASSETGEVLWPCVWVFQAKGSGSENAADAVDAAFTDLVLGEQLARLRLGSAATWSAGVVTSGPEPGHVVYGPYLRLAAGTYAAKIALTAQRTQSHGSASRPALAEVSVGSAIVDQREIAAGTIRPEETSVSLQFRSMGLSEPVEIRVWTDGTTAVSIASVVLERAVQDLSSSIRRPSRRRLLFR